MADRLAFSREVQIPAFYVKSDFLNVSNLFKLGWGFLGGFVLFFKCGAGVLDLGIEGVSDSLWAAEDISLPGRARNFQGRRCHPVHFGPFQESSAG